MSDPLPPVLAAEDEESDAFLLRQVFRRAGIPHRLVLVHDGREAVGYLSGEGIYADRSRYPLPVLLLLDLKMPRMNGFDVLTWRSSRPELAKTAIVVFSSSSDERDRRRALELGASEYLIKPHSLSEYTAMIHAVWARWLSNERGEIPRAPEQPPPGALSG